MSRTVSTLLLVAGLVLLGLPATVLAQESKTLVICDGAVFINGQVIPGEELPASLNPEGVDAKFSFAGDVEPIIEINDRIYRLEEGRLEDLGASSSSGREGRVSVFFRDGNHPAESNSQQELRFYVGNEDTNARTVAPNYAVVEQYAQAIHDQASKLQSLNHDAEQQALEQLVEQLLLQAEQTAALARELPRLEMENYLLDLQEQNQDLYRLLTREYQLERETEQLAAQYEAAESEEEREASLEELRGSLEEIFEMKQQNRQHEIERLEKELTKLRRRLEKRERYRDRIIEKRLRQLTEEGVATRDR